MAAPLDVAVTGLVLVLHDVRDPGNAGTIIRSADAAGVTAVVFTGQSVDPVQPQDASRERRFDLSSAGVRGDSLEEALVHFVDAGRAHASPRSCAAA